jgi:tetratricopeptide (TPR) repeat protein
MAHSFQVSRLTCSAGLVAACLAVMPGAASAGQNAAGCQGASCELTVEDAFSAVAQISRHKQEFVGAIRQLILLLAGTFGDEGPRIRATLQSTGTVLASWDRAILQLEERVRAGNRPAEIHLALGVAYLDRYRLDAAQREFAEAARLNPRRPDAHTYQALVQTLSNKPAAAAAAFAKAATLDTGRPALLYSLARQLALAGQDGEASKALQAFVTAQQARLGNPSVQDDGRGPFERVALLRQAPGVLPILPPALYAEAFASLTRGAYPEALDLFRQAFDRDPLSRGAASGDRLADGSAALRAGNVPLAIQHLRAVVASEPARAEAHRILGVALREADQPDDSLAAFMATIGLDPADERARVSLADIYGAAGRDEDAERTLLAAIAAMPASGQAHYSLGRLYQLMAKNLDAARAFEQAAERNPLVGQDLLYDAIGGIYLAEGDFDKAAAAYQTRVDVSPNNAEAHRKLGDLLQQRNQPDEALAEFMAALLVDPNNVPAYAGMAQLRLQQGKYAEAASAAQTAVNLDPAHPGARYSLGASLLRLGRKAEGQREIEVFEKMQAANRLREDRDWELRLVRQAASTSLDKGDIEDVAVQLRKALELAPEDPQAYISLGVVVKKLGRHAEAIELFQKAVAMKAGGDVHRLLAESYEALGRTSESQRHRALYDRARQERLQTAGGGR